MSRSIRVAVLGATGVAGQQFLAALEGHPWMKVVKLAASPRSAGKRYQDAIRDSQGRSRWYVPEPLAPEFADIEVENAADMSSQGVDLVFSALESDAARELEPLFAKDIPLVSTASAFRYEPDVPILLPGVNPEHARMLDEQRKNRGWKGFVAPGPNCTTVGLAISLKPLMDKFGLKMVLMTSMQAVSGAGRSPGVPSLDVIDNLVPFISGEEEKVQVETRKILGKFESRAISPHPALVSCTCTRVPVIDGHTESVFVSLERKASLDEAKAAFASFGSQLREMGLPSLPEELIHFTEEPDRPQPRLDRDRGKGMTTTIGRLREDTALENGLKYVLVSHNTGMGAARGAILTAEWLATQGYIS